MSKDWTFRACRAAYPLWGLTQSAAPPHISYLLEATLKAQSAEALVRLMVTKDPLQTADTILAFLMGVNRARSGAIFAVENGLSLLVGHRIGQEALDWSNARWRSDHAHLAQGRLSRVDNQFLMPVVRGGHLTAIVFLAAVELDIGSLSEVSGLIAEAVARASRQPRTASAVEAYLVETPSEEIERQKLLILLDRHEWNLARVARELKVTRTTIYKRLESFGISRKHVAKDRKEAYPVPASS